MAAGGQTGGFGNMGGTQQSMQAESNPYSNYFAAPYTPPPPVPAQVAPQQNLPSGRSQSFPFMGGQQNLFGRGQSAPAPAPAPFNPAPAGPQFPDQFYQTPPTLPSGTRPSSSAGQFFQPIYRPQYQDYNMGNPYGVSMYGQSPFLGGMGFNPYVGNYGRSPQFGQPMQFNPQMLGMMGNLLRGQQSAAPSQSPASQALSGLTGGIGAMGMKQGGIASLMKK